MNKRASLSGLAVGVALLLGFGGGCDSAQEEVDLFQVATGTHDYTMAGAAGTDADPAPQQSLHLADSLDHILQQYPDAGSPELRRLIEEISQRERQIGEGTVSGTQANQIRQQHEEYWSYLRDGQLPPAYR